MFPYGQGIPRPTDLHITVFIFDSDLISEGCSFSVLVLVLLSSFLVLTSVQLSPSVSSATFSITEQYSDLGCSKRHFAPCGQGLPLPTDLHILLFLTLSQLLTLAELTTILESSISLIITIRVCQAEIGDDNIFTKDIGCKIGGTIGTWVLEFGDDNIFAKDIGSRIGGTTGTLTSTVEGTFFFGIFIPTRLQYWLLVSCSCIKIHSRSLEWKNLHSSPK